MSRNISRAHSPRHETPISRQAEPSPVYMLEWDRQGCRQVYFEGVDELRVQLEMGKPTGAEPASAHRLFVVHGLPSHLIGALRTCVDIDPAFLEAHARRRRYRPLRWRKDARFAHYNYPELVHGYATSLARKDGEASRVRPQSNVVDLLDSEPAILSIGGGGDLAAMFCHASLWISMTADVLFLDWPAWQDPSSALRKARRQSSIVKPCTVRPNSAHEERHSEDDQTAQGDEIGSFEDILHETLKDAAEVGDPLVGIFTAVCFDHWLELFELLEPISQRAVERTAAFYWQVTKSLEQNVDMAQYLARHRRPCAVDWASLLARVQFRIDILRVASGRAVSVPRLIKTPESSKKLSRGGTYNSSFKDSYTSGNVPSLRQTEDDNKRSLDRISYLGGVLIPMPVISGILAMGDTYGPGGPLFYVFWAVSIPMSVVVVMIIYADIIRKFEVWVEIQADNVSPSTVELSSRRKAEVVPTTVDVFTERKETVTWSSPADGQRMYRHRPVSEAVNFTLGHEETSIGLPTAEAPDEVEGGLTPEEAPNTVDLPDPDCILDQATDGSRPKKAWKRQQLGWAGAVQTMFGHRKMRHAEDIPPGVLAYEKPERRKTVTL